MNLQETAAVLLKVHFWDDFVERQYERLCVSAGSLPVFIAVDETNRAVPDIPHENVMRMKEDDLLNEGYLPEPRGSVFWYNTDYQVYSFFNRTPSIRYLLICEYDCIVETDITALLQCMESEDLAFVGEEIRTPRDAWHWREFARPYYPADLDYIGRLVCCSGFSRPFAAQLAEARRSHTQQFIEWRARGDQESDLPWPNNEAFVGAEIARLGAKTMPLSAFGSTRRYDWAPPYPEFLFPNNEGRGFIHPVLDTPRYLKSLKKMNWSPNSILDAHSPLSLQLADADPRHYILSFAAYFAEQRDFLSLERLAIRFPQERSAHSLDRLNIAVGKPATQSSTSPWSRHPNVAKDAAGAVSGYVSGDYGFHTNFEVNPWWIVDLEATYPIAEVHVYNRLSMADRARGLIINISTDGIVWHPLYAHESGIDFGGKDGNPLRVPLPGRVEARFLRLHLPHYGALHLDEIQVYV